MYLNTIMKRGKLHKNKIFMKLLCFSGCFKSRKMYKWMADSRFYSPFDSILVISIGLKKWVR